MTPHKLLRRNPPCDLACEIQLIESPEQGFSAWVLFCSIVLGVIILLGCAQTAHASVTEDQAVKVIVGEASNQGFKGMVCVAEVLRHKGSTKGFYGLRAKHSAYEPKWVWMKARKAWLASANTNYTHGATHFENIHAFGCPYWVSKYIETFRWKDHVFYKETA